MKKHGMSLINPALVNAAQMGEIMSPIITEVLKLSPERCQYWIGKKGKLQNEIRKILVGSKVVVPGELDSWVVLYRDCFGLELDITKLVIPEYQENTWIVPVHESLTEQVIYDACKVLFNCDKSIDFSSIQDLHRKGTTVRRFKANVEADEEYKNKSANDLKKEGLEEKSITLKERMLLELWYFKTTGKHLDVGNWTLCNGSRSAGGVVPYASWFGDDRRFCLRWSDPGYQYGYLRSRVAVS